MDDLQGKLTTCDRSEQYYVSSFQWFPTYGSQQVCQDILWKCIMKACLAVYFHSECTTKIFKVLYENTVILMYHVTCRSVRMKFWNVYRPLIFTHVYSGVHLVHKEADPLTLWYSLKIFICPIYKNIYYHVHSCKSIQFRKWCVFLLQKILLTFSFWNVFISVSV